jgi:Dolichyl-phosphate-mannose-protein mannosyltransferase
MDCYLKIRFIVLLFFIFIEGLLLRLPQTRAGLPAARHPDSIKTVGVARHLSEDWRQGKYSLDPKSYQYPTLYPYLLSFSYLVIDKTTDKEMVGRFITALMGLLAMFSVFLIGTALRGPWTGMGAAVLLANGFLFVEQGRYANPDAPQMLLASLGLFSLLRNKQLSHSDIFWSGLWSGLAMGTKFTAPLFIFPLLAIMVGLAPMKISEKINSLLIWGGMLMAGFLIATPTFLVQAGDYIHRFNAERHLQRLGGFGEEGPGLLGYLFRPAWIPSEATFKSSLVHTLGWPFTIIGLLSSAWLIRQYKVLKDPRSLGLVVSTWLGYLFFSFVSNIQAMRFLLIWALLLVIGIVLLLTDVSERLSRPRVIFAAFLLLILIPNFKLSATYLNNLSQPDTRLTAVQWIFQNIPPGERLLNFMHGPALPQQRYEMIQWPLPEFKSELGQPYEPPSYQRLKKEKISWVILNSYYTRRFSSDRPQPDEAVYFQQWDMFRKDLERSGIKRHSTQGVLSPEIDIYFIPNEKLYLRGNG